MELSAEKLGSWLTVSVSFFLLASGCEGPQSALAPSGLNADVIYDLFLVMTTGAALIWLTVMGLALYAFINHRDTHNRRETAYWIIGGGVVAPTLVLTVMLVYGLSSLPSMLTETQDQQNASIRVRGYLWWWKVEYLTAGLNGQPRWISTANEICLPVDEDVTFELSSQDVIHSFWIPSLGGKMDLFPGRTSYLTLRPTKTGQYRGACAEYCGESHAWMALNTSVVTREEFEAWLSNQSSDAVVPRDEVTQRGQSVFLLSGCGACHAIRGTQADGVIGPDLTHLASRKMIGSGVLTNDPSNLSQWIRNAKSLKPAAKMPPFTTISDDDMNALTSYLTILK